MNEFGAFLAVPLIGHHIHNTAVKGKSETSSPIYHHTSNMETSAIFQVNLY